MNDEKKLEIFRSAPSPKPLCRTHFPRWPQPVADILSLIMAALLFVIEVKRDMKRGSDDDI